jgi:hypothetical protein
MSSEELLPRQSNGLFGGPPQQAGRHKEQSGKKSHIRIGLIKSGSPPANKIVYDGNRAHKNAVIFFCAVLIGGIVLGGFSIWRC